MKKALVLSGGGVRGAFDAGFCYYLAKKGWKPDFIIGTSVGAFNGAFLSETENFFDNAVHLVRVWTSKVNQKSVLNLNREFLYKFLWAESVYSRQNLKDILLENLKARLFSDLKIPLLVNTIEYHTAECKVFRSGKLIPPIIASCSVPPLLPPVKIGNSTYVDGGITYSSMVKEAKKKAQKKSFT